MATALPYKVNQRPKYDVSDDDVNEDDVNVIINKLSDEEKMELFKGTCKLLKGRNINITTNKISSPSARLFELREEENSTYLSDCVDPMNNAKFDAHESKNSLQQSLTESSYFEADVQAKVAGFGGGSIGGGLNNSQSSNTSESTRYFTATRLIKKGELAVDERCVKYNDKFVAELDLLLETQETREEEWRKLTNKYGQFYISQCEIGGVAYVTKKETLKENEDSKQKTIDFQASLEVAVGVGSGGAGTKYENDSSNTSKSSNSTSTVSLNCHGGNSTLCSTDKFKEWEKSVDQDHLSWDVVNVLKVQPFYYLFDVEKQQKIKKLMPKPKESEEKETEDPSSLQQIIKKQGKVETNRYLSMMSGDRWAVLSSDPIAKNHQFIVYQEDGVNFRIDEAAEISIDDEDDEERVFCIKTKDEKDISYKAPSKSERDKWIQALENCKQFEDVKNSVDDTDQVGYDKLQKENEEYENKSKSLLDKLKKERLDNVDQDEKYDELLTIYEQLKNKYIDKVQIIADGTYKIIAESGLVFDRDGNEGAVQIYRSNTSWNQRFDITHIEDGWYEIKCKDKYFCVKDNGWIFCLDLDDKDMPKEVERRQFKFTQIPGNKRYFITPKSAKSGEVFDVDGGLHEKELQKLHEWTFHGGKGQQFNFKRIE